MVGIKGLGLGEDSRGGGENASRVARWESESREWSAGDSRDSDRRTAKSRRGTLLVVVVDLVVIVLFRIAL